MHNLNVEVELNSQLGSSFLQILLVKVSVIAQNPSLNTCMSPFVVPTQPTIGLTTPTETSVSITWTVDAGSVVESYRVLWQRDTSVGCPGEDEGNETLTGDPTSHNVTGLEEDSSYIITLWASNAAGSVDVGVAVMTLEAGMYCCCFLTSIETHVVCM